jgi:hypothetical protein
MATPRVPDRQDSRRPPDQKAQVSALLNLPIQWRKVLGGVINERRSRSHEHQVRRHAISLGGTGPDNRKPIPFSQAERRQLESAVTR